jgi:hypothetical protein
MTRWQDFLSFSLLQRLEPHINPFYPAGAFRPGDTPKKHVGEYLDSFVKT